MAMSKKTEKSTHGAPAETIGSASDADRRNEEGRDSPTAVEKIPELAREHFTEEGRFALGQNEW